MVVDTVALEKGLRVEYNKAYKAMLASPEFKLIAAFATAVPSNSNSEKYGWLGDLPIVKEWLGEKTAGGLQDYDYSIANKDWYTAVGIDRNEIEDDKLGAIIPRIQGMPQALLAHRWEMIEDLLVNGATGLAYDAAAFFSNRAAPNDNLLAGTGTTVAQIQADIATAYAAMYNFESDTGRKLRFKMNGIACPVELYATFLEATTVVQGAATFNPAAQFIDSVVPIPGLADANDWYGLCTGLPLKPLILQTRKEPTPVLDDTQVKSNRKLIYSAEGRSNAGYGFFEMAVKVVNA